MNLKLSHLILLLFLYPFPLFGQLPSLHTGGYLVDGLDIIVAEMKLDAHGNFYTMGSFTGSGDFDRGAATYTGTSVGVTDLFVMKSDSVGNFLWAKFLGSVGYDEGSGLSLDAQGNVYVAGLFDDMMDFDPGLGTYNLTPTGQADSYVLKLTSQGDFVWAKQFGGSILQYGRDVVVDSVGDVIVAGEFYDTGDFDPGPATYTLNGIGMNGYLVKLDNAGLFQWAKQLGTTNRHLSLDPSNNILVAGQFTGTADLDPGPQTYQLQTGGTFDMAFVEKLNPNGNFIWAKEFGDTSFTSILDLETDPNGNVVLAGEFIGTDDFDPSIGTNFVTSFGSTDIIVVSLDSDGNFRWLTNVEGQNDDYPTDVCYDRNGNIYVTGIVQVYADFYPGIGSYVLDPFLEGVTYIEKLSPTGQLVWALDFGTGIVGANGLMCIGVNDSLQIVSVGSFGSAAFDMQIGPGSNNITTGSFGGAFLMLMNQDSCASVVLYADSAQSINCTNGGGFISLSTTGGFPPYSYAWNTTPVATDSLLNVPHPGIYTVTMTDAHSCNRTMDFVMTAPSTMTGFDLQAELAVMDPVVGRNSWLFANVFNDGCSASASIVSVILDPMAHFVNAIPAPNAIHGDTLVWNTATLIYGASHFQAMVRILTDSMTVLGDTLCFALQAEPTIGDFNPTNNSQAYCMPVLSSYDPNIMQVYPQGLCEEHYVLPSEQLTYTVQFQNTGNSEAYEVSIFDTISADLDLNTFRILGSSHPVQILLLDNRVLQFTFLEIHLPDSATDEPASHGYLIYEISPNTQLLSGTVVENMAEIVFDFNSPVATNRVSNTIIDVIPACAVGLIPPSLTPKIVVFPNPAQDRVTVASDQYFHTVRLWDSMGKLVMTSSVDDGLLQAKIDVRQLPRGLFLVEINAKAGNRFAKVLLR